MSDKGITIKPMPEKARNHLVGPEISLPGLRTERRGRESGGLVCGCYEINAEDGLWRSGSSKQLENQITVREMHPTADFTGLAHTRCNQE